MYSANDIRHIIETLRVVFPSLSLDSILDDLEKAVEEFGVDVRYAFMEGENKGVSGYLKVDNGSPLIVLNAQDSFARRRFTLAHELGHLILHWNWLPGDSITEQNGVFEVSYRNKTGYTPEEALREADADTFAGEFLLPLKSVQECLGNTTISNSDISRLARMYQVSLSCATTRVAKLRSEGLLNV